MGAVFREKEGMPSTYPNCQNKGIRVDIQMESVERQDQFFRTRGTTWRRTGLIVAVALTLLLISLEIIVRYNILNLSNDLRWYATYDPVSNQRQYFSEYTWLWLLALILGLLVFSFIFLRSKRESNQDQNQQRQASSTITNVDSNQDEVSKNPRNGATILLFVVGTLLVAVAVFWPNADFLYMDNVILLLGGFLLINIGRLARYEGMTYEEYNRFKSDEQIHKVVRGWYDYVFDPRPGLNLKDILWKTAALFW
jgi:hypothetical protein